MEIHFVDLNIIDEKLVHYDSANVNMLNIKRLNRKVKEFVSKKRYYV